MAKWKKANTNVHMWATFGLGVKCTSFTLAKLIVKLQNPDLDVHVNIMNETLIV